ncbi:hypothetical protein FIU93_22975 [Labrenzia sp. THAF35]|uniref:hypothetical protein n=1 Tax=Labrenzia sp. THAF35 TaxID=2587854 RepID=UPI00126835FF|nr:hypothetical protein [Labrenzia sp. THAF35]QFT69666.1 hypothetical protein FIU93_22975 [Labrenzia sp. THAF35]
MKKAPERIRAFWPDTADWIDRAFAEGREADAETAIDRMLHPKWKSASECWDQYLVAMGHGCVVGVVTW